MGKLDGLKFCPSSAPENVFPLKCGVEVFWELTGHLKIALVL